MKARTLQILALALAALAVAASPSSAQTTTGAIMGVVRDADGAVIPGAAVTARHDATNGTTSTVSDREGLYALRGLPVGQYTVTTELAGFQTFQAPGVVVRVNDEVRLDISLRVGAVTETVTVNGSARTVDTNTSTLRTVVDQQRIENLPLNGRNPTQLMTLVAGVLPDTTTSLTSGATYPGVQPVSSGGARANTTNYVLDGGSNNDHYSNAPNPMPNPDALQEFSVQTNSFGAEYGRNAGAIVNAVTRAGSNDLRGVAFGYLRHHKLNASNFFTPGETDGLERNQYGGTLGGPILRNRTFFFGSYQGTTQKSQPQDRGALVPTAAMRAGDFSAISRQLRNPFTGEPFPGNQIPVSLFNPAALTVVNQWLPLPNPGAGDPALQLNYRQSVENDDHQYLTRLDHRFSNNHSLYGRVWVSRASTPPALEDGNALNSAFGRTWQNTIVSVNDSYVISPRLVNNVVVTFNRTNNDNFHVLPPDYASLGITDVYNDGAPQWFFNVNGYFGINTGDTNTFLRDEFQVVNTTRWSAGNHELAFGADYAYGQGDIVNNFRANGRYTFNGSAPFSGDALVDFMLGKFSSFEQGIGEYKNTRMHSIALFVQDNYRVNSKLTLNLGLRWDPFTAYKDQTNRTACYRPGVESGIYSNAPLGAAYPGDDRCPEGGYDADWLNLGPRLGFAYDPFGDGRTSVRAGYGVFFDRPNTIATNSAANQGPFGTVLSFPGNAVNSLTTTYAGRSNPFPADPFDVPSDVAFVLPHQMFSFSEDFENGTMQNWHVTVEREVVPTWMVRVAYAGSHGTSQPIGRELNPALYSPGATTATTNQRRPLFPDFGPITMIEPTGESSYHAMQLSLDKRFSKGFTVLANYTLSKSLDHSSENKLTGVTQTNPYDLEFDWGPANFDRRHRLVTSWLWEIPGRPSNGVLNAVAGGWALSGIWTWQSGQPFSITSGVDNARTGTGGQRADQIGDPTLSGDRSRGDQIQQWFNTAAFTANALGTFGNTGRNGFRGPGYAAVDLGLQKTFAVTDQVKTQLRIEAFNVLNNVNLGLPVSAVNNGNFGRILTADSPRVMQLALRVMF
jgi:outer membrane receptor protein involved in Fe transport